MVTETIIGSYRIEERIGGGGMGVVYRGRHTKLPREVAIKSINARGNHDLRRLKHRFEREAYIQSQLDHPAIVKVYDYIVTQQTYYIVMEYVAGRSLAELLAQEGHPLPIERALNLFERILRAVIYAHNFVYRDERGLAHHGIIHRDLKPANILVTHDDQIKITDFGIVKLVGAENTDSSGIRAYGSPHYVSPEQAEGAPLDQRSDIYSLGVILYEMLTGHPPFSMGEKPLSRTDILRAHVEQPPRLPSEINKEVMPEIEAVILRALEKKPEHRFATVIEFLRAVRRARGSSTGDIPEPTAATHTSSGRIEPKERYDSATEQALRGSYATQPIRTTICAKCGTEAAADETACRVCGHHLSASPATIKLTEREALKQPASRRIPVVAAALFSLLLLGIGTYYVIRHSRPMPAPIQTAQPAVADSPTPMAKPVPPAVLIEIRPSRVEVDSSFDGYSAKPITDGVTDVRRIATQKYNLGNWVSAETPDLHWIELSFDHPTRIAAVYIYWGYDHNRFMPSRRVELQALHEREEWHTISAMEPGEDYDRTAFEFAPMTTSRVRIIQPAQQGPKNRPFVMWVREVKVYGMAEIPPPQ